METGTKISLSVHGALLLGLLVGNPFRSEPLPMNVQDVAVISEADFARLQSAQTAPDAVTDLPTPDPAPQDTSPPDTPAPETPVTQAPDTPDVAAAPEVEDVPDLPQILPDAEVEDTPPEISQPAEDVAVLVPETAPEAVPQQADRVAPEPVQPPAPDAAPAPETQEAVVPDDAPAEDTPVEEPQEATAPEAAAPELVTEADRPAAAPVASLRPRTRPARAPAQADTSTPAPQTAQSETPSEPATPAPAENIPLGPPLTGGEREGLRVAVASCWNVGALSTEAQETRVTVYVAMNRDGTPQADTIRLLSSEGGSDAAARRVFDTARRAILRCGARGFPLPVEKYGQWREIEMTFNPEGIFWR